MKFNSEGKQKILSLGREIKNSSVRFQFYRFMIHTRDFLNNTENYYFYESLYNTIENRNKFYPLYQDLVKKLRSESADLEIFQYLRGMDLASSIRISDIRHEMKLNFKNPADRTK